MVVGVAVEVLQTRVAGQDAEARDLAADAAGAAVALLAPPLLGWFGGGRTHARHGTWAPTSIVPIGIAAATVFGGVLVGLTYLRHVGGGVLGDDPPPTWVLHRPVAAGIAAGLIALLVGRTLVFFARVEAAVASTPTRNGLRDGPDGTALDATAAAADDSRGPDELGTALAPRSARPYAGDR